MYLHNDKDLFAEVITEINTKTGIAQSIVEKDYYVTMILKLLAKSNPDTVFKGGTALSIHRKKLIIDGFFDKLKQVEDYYISVHL